MLSRRLFLGSLSIPVGAALAGAGWLPRAHARTLPMLSDLASDARLPSVVARDESFWLHAQQAFTVDRSLVNLNNGGVCPSPAVVQEAMKRHLDFSNTAPTHAMWRVLEPRREGVRQRLARYLDCGPEEVALTRNASEGLQICQAGMDLEPGDEVLTTNQDYPRMIQTYRQLEARRGIVLRQLSLPVPAEDPGEVVRRFEESITARTRAILMCHVINLTGQILPVRGVVEMARARGIPVIVDGAHSFAHFPFTIDELGCDYFATSLHKWLCAPHGTGLLYVRRDRVEELWPLQAPPVDRTDDIRKFEEIGTHPAAPYLAVGEALTFHLGLGSERKSERLRYLKDYWATRLLENERVRLHTSLQPDFACGLATVQVEGIDSARLTDHLWSEHKIITTTIKHEEFEGVRVSPNVYTHLEELDRFCDAVETVIERGIEES
jgi:selenocysteine lyase/cysteine desulfurase